MNNRGQIIFVGFMLGVTIIILALALAKPVNENIDISLNASNLDCGNSSISYDNQAACIATDSIKFYFVGSLIFIGGVVILARIII